VFTDPLLTNVLHNAAVLLLRAYVAGTCLPSRCLETAVCLFAYFIETAVLVCFEVSAEQRVYTPQYYYRALYISSETAAENTLLLTHTPQPVSPLK
jgi:hypothetical protein